MFRSATRTLLAGALSLSLVTGALAQTSDEAEISVVPSSTAGLTASITGVTFPQVNYSFDDQQSSGQIAITATDSRGTAAGWNVTLSGTDFSDGGTQTFPVNNLTLEAGTVSVDEGQSAPLPTTTALVPVATTEQKVMSAEVNSGAGSYTNDVNATVTVPGGTLVGTYKSVLTVNITTGP